MIPAWSTSESDEGFRVTTDLLRVRSVRRIQFIDLTDRIEACVRSSGIEQGLVAVQTLHTTTGILVNENEPLLLQDLEDLFERFVPRDACFRHDDLPRRAAGLPPDERRNGDAHARATLLRTSETLHVVAGALRLGTWQRVFLVELDGERDRAVSVVVLGSGAVDV